LKSLRWFVQVDSAFWSSRSRPHEMSTSPWQAMRDQCSEATCRAACIAGPATGQRADAS
jgi:hypothetical protein